MFILLFVATAGYCQVFTENFNSGLPTTWLVLNNGVGLGQSWQASPLTFGNDGSIATMVANETGTTLNPVQDWLITPQINLTTVNSPQLRFFGKTTPVAPDRNSLLKVMISTTGTNFSDFQLIDTFSETFTGATNPISPNANFFEQVINLTGYENTTIYIAFVMENTGVGKTWLLDDVSVVDQCLDVVDIQLTNVTTDSATVSWSDPSNSGNYQLELVSGTNLPTGVPTSTSTATNYTFTDLVEGEIYKVYIKSLCPSLNSNWVVSSDFQVQPLGTTCATAIEITSFPYFDTNYTGNYQDNYTGEPGTGCGYVNEYDWEETDYLFGNDVVYSITPTTNIVVNIEMTTDTPYAGFFIYDDCDNIGVLCVDGMANNSTEPRILNNLNLSANTTYYIVVSNSSFSYTNEINYTLKIQQVFCQPPHTLAANFITANSASLSWTNDASIQIPNWQIVIQEQDAGFPLGAGLDINQNIYLAQQTYSGNNLLPGTTYEFYVRSSCGDGNFSPWTGPFVFVTECLSFDLPFYEGFNSDSTTKVCWKVIDVNNDVNTWQLNFDYDFFEGDQVAAMQSISWEEDASNNDWLISPRFNLNGQYRLKYHYKINSYNEVTQPFEVKMSTTTMDIPSFNQVLVPQEDYSNNEYLQKVVYLPNTTGQMILAWHVPNVVNSDVLIDNVIIEAVPSCPEPYDIIVDELFQNSITINWSQFGIASSWDVIAIPAPGTINDDLSDFVIHNTTTKPFTIPGLNSATAYNIYVRSHCNDTEVSEWSSPFSAFTLIENDECDNSVTVPVNPGIECLETVSGSLIGATASNIGDVCTFDFEVNEVWFDFVAEGPKHMIKLENMSIPYEDVYIVVYTGNCIDGLTQYACSAGIYGGGSSILNLDGLTQGETYVFKIYSSNPTTDLIFEVCIITPEPVVYVSETDYTVEELVTNVLVGNECLVSNITWRTGTDFGQGNGISYFNKNNSSFAFEDGIVLSTGDFSAVPGPANDINISSGGMWDGDNDLLVYMQNQGLDVDVFNDASVLEFDFTPTQASFSFDFIFASNEYGFYQCSFSDAFAFFLTDLTTNVTTNLALVPGSNAPISVTTIRNELHSPMDFDSGLPLCPNENETYFDKCFDPFFNGLDPLLAPINFKGYTVPLSAQANVTPGNSYHIKMVVANRNDNSFDSAVFLLGGSFDLGNIDLGADLTIETNNAICAGDSHILQTQLDANAVSIKWFKDEVEILGQTANSLVVNDPGIYKIVAQFIGSDCTIEDEIKVEFYPDVLKDLVNPNDLEICLNQNNLIDITVNESVIFSQVDLSNYIVTYYNSLQDLQNNVNAITNPLNYDLSNGTQIFISVKDLNSLCEGYLSFNIKKVELIPFPDFSDLEICNIYQLPNLPEQMSYHSLPNGGGEKYASGQELLKGEYTIYVLSQNGDCSDEISFTVNVKDCIIPKGISPNGDGLNDTFDLSLYYIRDIKIFNRFGTEVFTHGAGYTNQWHGQDNSGNKLPSGTYFYVIETSFESFIGWVQLVH